MLLIMRQQKCQPQVFDNGQAQTDKDSHCADTYQLLFRFFISRILYLDLNILITQIAFEQTDKKN